MTPQKPKKSRPSWADAVKALNDEVERSKGDPEHYTRDRGVAFARAVSFLNTLNPPKKKWKRRTSVAPTPHSNGSNGTNGGAE
jgi:hypothetical protein